MNESGDRLRGAFVEVLLEHIRRDPFPSTTMMNLVERHADRRQAETYLALLLDKLASARYPSADFMNRVGHLLP